MQAEPQKCHLLHS